MDRSDAEGEAAGLLRVVVELARSAEDGGDGVIAAVVLHGGAAAIVGRPLSLEGQEDDHRRDEGQGAGVAAEEGRPAADEAREARVGPAVLEAPGTGGGIIFGAILDGLVLRPGAAAGPIRHKCRQFVHDINGRWRLCGLGIRWW